MSSEVENDGRVVSWDGGTGERIVRWHSWRRWKVGRWQVGNGGRVVRWQGGKGERIIRW